MSDNPLTVSPRGSTYLQNIFLIRIQDKFKGLIPHWVYVIVEVSCPLPAVRGWGDEKFHVGVWSVNCRHGTQVRRRQVWFMVPTLLLLIGQGIFNESSVMYSECLRQGNTYQNNIIGYTLFYILCLCPLLQSHERNSFVFRSPLPMQRARSLRSTSQPNFQTSMSSECTLSKATDHEQLKH